MNDTHEPPDYRYRWWAYGILLVVNVAFITFCIVICTR